MKAPVLRDAPSDTGTTGGIERGTIQQNRSEAEVRGRQVSQKNKSVIKKRKTVKPLRVDPLKSRNIIQLLPVV